METFKNSVSLVLGTLILKMVVVCGETCECNIIKNALSVEMLDLKIENIQMKSRVKTLESMMQTMEPVISSLKNREGDQHAEEEDKPNSQGPNVKQSNKHSTEYFALRNLIHKALRDEKLERRRLEIRLEQGLVKINESLVEFDNRANAVFASHRDTLSAEVEKLNNVSAERIEIIRNDVSDFAEKLENERSEINKGRKVLERAIGNISKNVSSLETNLNSVIDIALLEKTPICDPNCENGGVCFKDGSCRCKELTEGSHCQRFICDDQCFENGGDCVGPGVCKCVSGRHGHNCEKEGCVVPQLFKKSDPSKVYKRGDLLDLECEPGFILRSRVVTCLANGSWSDKIECIEEATDCYDLGKHASKQESGVHEVKLWQSKALVNVYCDMDTDGGGWTVFQRRFNGSVEFYRTFSEYEKGFGDLNSEFWLGLQYVHELVSQGPTELRIDVSKADGTTGYEIFPDFTISASPDFKLGLKLGGKGTIGDSTANGMSFNNGCLFSTFDNDRDTASGSWNCALENTGAWWYCGCMYVNLNGKYCTPGSDCGYAGMIYYLFDRLKSLKTSRMMFRRL